MKTKIATFVRKQRLAFGIAGFVMTAAGTIAAASTKTPFGFSMAICAIVVGAFVLFFSLP